MTTLPRRDFLRLSGGATLAAALPTHAFAQEKPASSPLRLLHVGVGGMMGPSDHDSLKSHRDVVFAGLCDVDSLYLKAAAQKEPQAFTCRDFREAFRNHADKFDAVVVTTPDHTHAVIILWALKYEKHVYSQKPLVHEFSELRALVKALKARPRLKTQMGNQRCGLPARQQAVELLKSGVIGKAREAYFWTSAPWGDAYYMNREKPPEAAAPETLDWNLWLGPATERPWAKDAYTPFKWRNLWDFGTGGLGDFGCHETDVLFYAYPLGSPIAVRSDSSQAAGYSHAWPTRAAVTFQGGSWSAGDHFTIYATDAGVQPSHSALNIPPSDAFDANGTIVVGESGVLVLNLEGRLAVYRGGKRDTSVALPKMEHRNHYHDWVNACLGKGPGCMTPFDVAARITETVLMGPKAARFPGREFLWNGERFTNATDEENRILTTRDYRAGFELPEVR